MSTRPRGSTRPRTHTHAPAGTSTGVASSVPVRSPSTSRRPSLVRTISTWSMSCPGVRSQMRTGTNPRSRAGRIVCSAMPERTALVTGGAGGLGRSVVAALVEDGWQVVAPVRAGSDLGAQDGVRTVVADLTDPGDVARAVGASEEGTLRAVVNLVGGFTADQP